MGEAVGEVALVEQGIVDMALAEKLQSDHSAQTLNTKKAMIESLRTTRLTKVQLLSVPRDRADRCLRG